MVTGCRLLNCYILHQVYLTETLQRRLGGWIQDKACTSVIVTENGSQYDLQAHYCAESGSLFNSLKLLSKYDMYRHQLGLLMFRNVFQHCSGCLPALFTNYFIEKVTVQSYNTRCKHNYRSGICRTKFRQSPIRNQRP